MEAASNAEPKRSYSWWWDSHISPKNSKWLQDNLSDMDNKIKAMIKLIDEDADSFARRAEMYYKKRPDLMKLVEEFYRAYRALAERYDHVTGALRQAHKTIAVAFPNQVQITLPDEPPSGFLDAGDEHTYESGMQTKSNAIQWDGESLDEIVPFICKEGLKSLSWLFVDEDAQKKFGESLLKKSLNLKDNEGKHFEYKKLEEEVLDLSKENKNLKNEITLESLRADKAEAELQSLKDAISKLKTELESAFLQYKVSEERISSLEAEISESQAQCLHLNDQMSINVSKLSISEEQFLGLEKENTSLQLEMDKLNLVVSKQQDEVSYLFKESQDLHNRVNLESILADRAEADSIRSRDAVLRLKSEMESALLKYQFSQGRISDLEAEISRTKEQFKYINLEMSTQASKLNIAENQYLLLQEENKSLQRELDRFMNKVTSQEAEIIMREEELDKLENSIEFERQRNLQAHITENTLRAQLDILEQRVETQDEEIAIREQELNKLKQHVEDEWKQRLESESAHQALVEQHSKCQENLRHLDLENQNGAEKLRKTELRKSGLEEEIKLLRDENNSLSEENFSSVTKIIHLQDDINLLKAFKHKVQDQLRFNAEENMFLQQELFSFKSNNNDLEEDHHVLIDQLRRMELREATLEEETRCLHDENIDLYENFFSFSSKIVNLQDDMISLRESNYKLEDELQFHLEEKKVLQHDLFSLKNEKKISEVRHQELIDHIEKTNTNVLSLEAAVKELQDENKALRDTCQKYEDEKVCHLEQLMLMDNILHKNTFLVELKNLLAKIMGLKKYFESLYDNVHRQTSLEPVPVSYFEATQNTVNLSEKYSVIESSISDLNDIVDVLRGQLKALEDPCQSLCYQKSLSIAENSNLLSRVDRVDVHLQSLESRFVILEGKQVNKEEKDLTLHHIQEEHDDDICFFRNQLSALNDQILLVKQENLVMKEELGEEHLKTVKNELDSFIMEQFLVDSNEKNTSLFKECRKYMDKLELAENFIFELKQEWTSQETNLITMSNRNEKLLEGIHEMMKTCDTKKACKSYDIKKDHEISNDCHDNILQNILLKIVELHSAVAASKGNIHNFQLEKPFSFTLLEQLAFVLAELREQNKVLEQESQLKNQEIFILHKANHELMERNEHSWKDINAGKQREEMLIVEMKRSCARLLDLQEACHESQSEISKLLEENELLSKELCELRNQSDALKEETDAILEKAITQEHLSVISNSHNAEKSSDTEWLIRDVNYLYRITNDLGQEIRAINKSTRAVEAKDKVHQARNASNKLEETETRKKLLEQSNMELSDGRGIRTPEPTLNPEGSLLMANTTKVVREELELMLHDLHVSSFMELIFKEKFLELMQIAKGLKTINGIQLKIPVEETTIQNVQEEDLKEKFDALGRENKRLKAELSAFAPLVASLEKEIASLEERTLSLTNLHILNSKRKQGNIIISLQQKKSIQAQAKPQSQRESDGIMELKKLHAKVKVLHKEVTDTEGLLEQGTVVSAANETRKTTVLKSTGTPKKKNIILDLRKRKKTGKDVEQLKEDIFPREKHEQMMKDIELDHVLSSSQPEADLNVETNDHTIVFWERERSENPSSELLLEKELSVDNLVFTTNHDEPLQAWIGRVSASLSACSQRLLALENGLEELKMNILTSEMKCEPSTSELNKVKLQVKEAHEAFIKLTDFNYKLSKVAETFSLSSDSSKFRTKVAERVQRGAEKIDVLEQKLQKVQSNFSKLQEQTLESNAAKPMGRRSKLPLKDLIYGKRSDPKQMKRRFCSCMRFKTKET